MSHNVQYVTYRRKNLEQCKCRRKKPTPTFPNVLNPNQGKYPRNYAKMLLKKEEKAVPSAGRVLSKSQFQGLLTSSQSLFLYLAPEKD